MRNMHTYANTKVCADTSYVLRSVRFCSCYEWKIFYFLIVFFFLTFKTSSYFFRFEMLIHNYVWKRDSRTLWRAYTLFTIIVAKFPYGLKSLSQGTYTQINRKCWAVCLLFWYRLVFLFITCVCNVRIINALFQSDWWHKIACKWHMYYQI